MTQRLERKVAVVTGGARNIGASIVRQLAGSGHDVAIITRTSLEEAEELANSLTSSEGRAWTIQSDVADHLQVDRARDQILELAGRVDVLVNAAAVRPVTPAFEIDNDEWRRVLGVILDGAFHCCRAFGPDMAARGWGRIVNIIGVRGQFGAPGRAHVASAKSGLIGLTRSLAHELGPAGITVNAVSPGTIVTDRDRRDPSRLARRAEVGILGPGTPEDVAAAVGFLVSDGAGHITGQTLGVDGGEAIS